MDEIKDQNFLKKVIGWDVIGWQPILDYWQRALNGNNSGLALEIGCGPGGMSMWLAKLGFDVVCSDIELPNEGVKTFHTENNFNNIQYAVVDVLNIQYDSYFDVIVFKSVVGGVARDGNDKNRELMMEQIHKSLKPGGILIFAENLSASPFHKFFRKNFVRWGNSWNYGTTKNMCDALDVFDEVDFQVRGFLSAFGRNEFQRSLFSRIDGILFERIVPKSWKYIMYGYAIKAK